MGDFDNDEWPDCWTISPIVVASAEEAVRRGLAPITVTADRAKSGGLSPTPFPSRDGDAFLALLSAPGGNFNVWVWDSKGVSHDLETVIRARFATSELAIGPCGHGFVAGEEREGVTFITGGTATWFGVLIEHESGTVLVAGGLGAGISGRPATLLNVDEILTGKMGEAMGHLRID